MNEKKQTGLAEIEIEVHRILGRVENIVISLIDVLRSFEKAGKEQMEQNKAQENDGK